MNQLLSNQLALLDHALQPSNDSVMYPMVYDIRTDEDRIVTQDDVDRMQRTQTAFGELAKQIRFHITEVRNGLIKPGVGIDAIAEALHRAEQMAACLDLSAMEKAGVQGRHVLVVER